MLGRIMSRMRGVRTEEKKWAVTEEEAKRLRALKIALEIEIGKEGSDEKGVYDRLVKKVSESASNGHDIYMRGMNHSSIKEHKVYAPREIKEVALNKFARYYFYDLEKNGIDLKEQIRREANKLMERFSQSVKTIEAYGAKVDITDEVHKHNWLFALENIALGIDYFHWGTQLEPVEY